MKKTYNKMICIVLSVFLMLSALPLTVYAEAAKYSVSTSEELQAAVTAINNSGAGDYEIELTADITSTTSGISFSGEGVVVTIIGNDHYFSCFSGQNVQVWNGAKVILGDGETALTLIGGNNDNDNNNPGIFYIVDPKSVGIMNDKVTLKDNITNNHLGAGVSVQNGTFIMNGGTIENCGVKGGSVCYGGGVAVYAGGSFTMNNGTITKCYVESNHNSGSTISTCGGGVFVSSIASFTMNGGTISNNTATNTGGGISCGGGVALIISNNEMVDYAMGNPQSSVTINNGTITGNKAELGGGVFASGYYKALVNAAGTVTPGGGTPQNPGLFINGGEISANNAADGGGGIYAMCICPWGRKSGVTGAKTQIHNATIKNNTADNGAGIESYAYWTQMDIDGCTITGNEADSYGGGIALLGNSSSGLTKLKNSTVTDNTSGDIGAGVLYDADSKLYISGENVIQDNIYDNKLNNLNVYMEDGTIYPVYVNGDLTGSQIGLSDPTLWNDGKDDTDPTSVSTNYLTSGYKTNNSANPGALFTSDHETWIADFSDVNEDEVRLVRKTTVDYHINNRTIAKDKYNGNDIFTSYVAEATGKPVTVGETISSFYAIPEIKPTAKNSCPYIFKGWYYDKANDNDENPVDFGTDIYEAGRDIYAHWIEVKDVAKDSQDKYNLPEGETAYGGFDLTGVQVRGAINDTNFDGIRKPGGLRFMTSLSTDVVNEIKALQDGDNNIEYGYVAATRADWITAHQNNGDKLQYVSRTANGKNTSTYNKENPQDYFGFATNVNCTSQETNASDGIVPQDHRKFSGYLLYTLVITYENGTGYDKNVLARPYIKYTDANGLERVAYSEYRGNSNTLGGCYTSYNAVAPEQEG